MADGLHRDRSMPNLRVALVACLAVAGTATPAVAKPSGHHRKAKAKHHAPPVHDDNDDDDDNIEPRTVAFVTADDDDEDPLAAAGDNTTPDTEDDLDVAPVRLRKRAVAPPALRPWHVAVGPYLWAANVDASVNNGRSTIDAGVDFDDLKQSARYGFQAVAEVRVDRFSLQGDLTVGSVGIDMAQGAGPVDVAITGDAGSLLVDSLAGVRVLGTDDSRFAVEARTGLRYQRTSVNVAVDVDGDNIAKPVLLFTEHDMLAGARVFVRPHRRVALVGAADVQVAGSSSSSWSMSAEADVRVASRLLLALGYRTLTVEGTTFNTVMHGPRVTVQLLF